MNTIFIAGLVSIIALSGIVAEETRHATSRISEKAPAMLRETKSFIIGRAFEEGRITEPEIAFRALLERKDAIGQLRLLIKEASPSGQLYGLLGLRLLNAEDFDASYERFENLNTPISSMSGCIKFQTTAAAIAKEIKEGKIK